MFIPCLMDCNQEEQKMCCHDSAKHEHEHEHDGKAHVHEHIHDGEHSHSHGSCCHNHN